MNGFSSPGFSDDVFSCPFPSRGPDTPKTAPASLSSSTYNNPWDSVVPNNTSNKRPFAKPNSTCYTPAADELRNLAFTKSSHPHQTPPRSPMSSMYSVVPQHSPVLPTEPHRETFNHHPKDDRQHSLRWRSYSADCRSSPACVPQFDTSPEPPRLSHFPVSHDSYYHDHHLGHCSVPNNDSRYVYPDASLFHQQTVPPKPHSFLRPTTSVPYVKNPTNLPRNNHTGDMNTSFNTGDCASSVYVYQNEQFN